MKVLDHNVYLSNLDYVNANLYQSISKSIAVFSCPSIIPSVSFFQASTIKSSLDEVGSMMVEHPPMQIPSQSCRENKSEIQFSRFRTMTNCTEEHLCYTTQVNFDRR